MTNSYCGALLPLEEGPPFCGMGIFVVLLPLLLELLLLGVSLLPWPRVETVPVDSGDVVER
jgi:ABC-type multidrug transport system permease subunit